MNRTLSQQEAREYEADNYISPVTLFSKQTVAPLCFSQENVSTTIFCEKCLSSAVQKITNFSPCVKDESSIGEKVSRKDKELNPFKKKRFYRTGFLGQPCLIAESEQKGSYISIPNLTQTVINSGTIGILSKNSSPREIL